MPAESFQDLYRDAAFARRLAAALVGEWDSDEALQDAWRAMLEQPPRTASNLRGHLHTLVRRFLLRRRRSEARRRHHERVAAREGHGSSTAAIVERMEIHRRVVDVLLELDEPYQSTIFLTFFEGLSPAEIAQRQGVPLETVRTRAKRGIARLRERLVQVSGADREWLSGLTLLAELHPPRSAGARPRTALVAASAVLAAAVVATWYLRRSTTGAAPDSLLALPARAPPPEHDLAAPDGSLEPRRPVEVAGAAGSPALERPSLRLHGRVLDPSGNGVARAEVTLRVAGQREVHVLATGSADEEGRYSFALEPLSPFQQRNRMLEIDVAAHGMQPAREEIQLADLRSPALERDLVLAPGIMVEGRCLDERGAPVRSAIVLLQVSARGQASATRNAMSDQDGRFCAGLDDGTELTGIVGWQYGVGWGSIAREELLPAREELLRVPDLVLRELRSLRGRVVYPDGSPVTGLGVVVQRVQEDERGRFFLAVDPLNSDGLSRAGTYTEDDGAFLVCGLRDGEYAYGAGPPRVDREQGVPRERIAPAGGEDLRIVCDRHRLIVEVAGESGEPAPDVRIAFTPVAPAIDGGLLPIGATTRSVTDARGRAVFASDPGTAVAATILLPRWAEEVVFTVPERPYEVLQRRRIPETPPTGALRIASRDPGVHAASELTLATSIARLPLGSWRSDGDGLVSGLPSGRFSLEVLPTLDEKDPTGDGCFAPTSLDEVDIRADATTALEIPVARGARLVLLFQTPDGRAPQQAKPTHPDSDWVIWFPERPGAVLRRAQDPPEARPFLELNGAVPGVRWESARALPAGTYRLEAHFEGYEPVQQELEIVPCRAQEVTVPLTSIEGTGR